jgi:hypothetical protein
LSHAKLVTVILVEDTIGKGVDGDPIQPRRMLYSPSGELLCVQTALGGDYDHVHDTGGWVELSQQKRGETP